MVFHFTLILTRYLRRMRTASLLVEVWAIVMNRQVEVEGFFYREVFCCNDEQSTSAYEEFVCSFCVSHVILYMVQVIIYVTYIQMCVWPIRYLIQSNNASYVSLKLLYISIQN